MLQAVELTRLAVQVAVLQAMAAVRAEAALALLLAAAELTRSAVGVGELQAVAAVPAEGALVLRPPAAVVRLAVLQALAVWPLAPQRRPSLREHRPAALR